MSVIFENAADQSNLKSFNKSAVVIIGAGFGDEGKGLLTDYHAAEYGTDCIVARFNGGAQAGHTVVTPDGRRHVHSHFGSGTLTGAATFLSKHFVSHPLLFDRERAELEQLAVQSPIVYADERGLVTTPYDMLVNQWVEAARGNGKHGSCGIGFGETIERSLSERFAIRLSDLADADKLRVKLNDIRQAWIPKRLNQLNVPKLTAEQTDLLAAERLRENFIDAAARFYADISPARPNVLTTVAGVVFEGAQGLLLDEDYGWFPHVTRSPTGLRNAVELAAEAGINRLECVYATRAYATRHGAGHLPHELSAKPYAHIEDATNIPNPFQDNLRFGWLDLDLLSRTIAADFERYKFAADIKITKRLAVTCLDQVDERISFIRDDTLCRTTASEFLTAAAKAVNSTEVYVSGGKTRQTTARQTF